MIEELVLKNRSYRRFYQDVPVTRDTLKDLVNLARLSACAGNLQPLRFIISSDRERNNLIFPHLAWAAALKDWGGPVEGERPAAYIIILGDTEVTQYFGCDHGIAAQSMLLGAVEKGLGGCMIGSIDREALYKALDIPSKYKILLVVAIGKPKEKVVIDDFKEPGNIKYWRDSEQVHHVPKRLLDDIILY